MRTIINISVPAVLKKEIEYEVKTGGYASVSEFFRSVMRERAENAILLDVTESRREFLSGKVQNLKQNFYIVNGKFTKNPKKEMKDFEKFVYKNNTSYPLMVGQYEEIKCYMMQKLNDIL